MEKSLQVSQQMEVLHAMHTGCGDSDTTKHTLLTNHARDYYADLISRPDALAIMSLTANAGVSTSAGMKVDRAVGSSVHRLKMRLYEKIALPCGAVPRPLVSATWASGKAKNASSLVSGDQSHLMVQEDVSSGSDTDDGSEGEQEGR